jgi:hypothetical protein
MSKGRAKRNAEMLPEYDFSKGTRGKYAARYAQGSNIVVLEPEIAEVFPDSAAVNHALRLLMGAARKGVKRAAG